MKQGISFFVGLLFISCSKDITISNPGKLSLGLYPYLEVNQPIKIFAYSSVSVQDTGKVQLKNATALVYEDDKCVDTVELDKTGKGISKITPKEKKLYKIQVSAEKYPLVETEVIMPSALNDVQVDTSSIIESENCSYTIFTITFIDDAKTSDYYRINLVNKYYIKYPLNRFLINPFPFYCESEGIEFYSYQNGELYLTEEPKKLLENFTRKQNIFGQWYVQGGPVYTSDKFFNGKKISFRILSQLFKVYFYSNIEYQFRLEIAKISSDFYQGLYSQAKYNSNQNNDLPIIEEIPIYSSVKQGFGFAAASATFVDSSYSNQKYKEFFKK